MRGVIIVRWSVDSSSLECLSLSLHSLLIPYQHAIPSIDLSDKQQERSDIPNTDYTGEERHQNIWDNEYIKSINKPFSTVSLERKRLEVESTGQFVHSPQCEFIIECMGNSSSNGMFNSLIVHEVTIEWMILRLTPFVGTESRFHHIDFQNAWGIILTCKRIDWRNHQHEVWQWRSCRDTSEIHEDTICSISASVNNPLV